jgi:hypothetical protein
MRYLEETANNILRSLIIEMTTDGGVGGGGDKSGDQPMLPTDVPTDDYYDDGDPSGRPVEPEDEGMPYTWDDFFNSPEWKEMYQDYPQYNRDKETLEEYKDRVREFWQRQWEEHGDNPDHPIRRLPDFYGPIGPDVATPIGPGDLVRNPDGGGSRPWYLPTGHPYDGGNEGLKPTIDPFTLMPIGRGIGWLGRQPWYVGAPGGIGGEIVLDQSDTVDDLLDQIPSIWDLIPNQERFPKPIYPSRPNYPKP